MMVGRVDSLLAVLGHADVPKDTPAGAIKDALSVVKGFRNGIVYGAKIRLPHALVMTFLFRPEP